MDLFVVPVMPACPVNANPVPAKEPLTAATPGPSSSPRLPPRNNTVPPAVRLTAAVLPSTHFSPCVPEGVSVIVVSPLKKLVPPKTSVVEALAFPVSSTFAPAEESA